MGSKKIANTVTLKTITERLTKAEAGKEQVSIAQMSEVVGKLSDILVSGNGPEVIATLIKNGIRRKKRGRN